MERKKEKPCSPRFFCIGSSKKRMATPNNPERRNLSKIAPYARKQAKILIGSGMLPAPSMALLNKEIVAQLTKQKAFFRGSYTKKGDDRRPYTS